MPISTGQITIIDYNDALTLTGYISSNHPKTQQFNPDNGSYNPDWTSTNLILTPSLFKLGSATDIIASADVTSVKWYDAASPTTVLVNNTDYAIGTTGAKALTIKTNKLAGLPAKEYICEVNYHDPTTNLDLVHKMSINLSRVINGGGIADAVVFAPNGNIFKNANVSSLTAQAQLWRGSVIDTTSVTYQWYVQDPSVTTDQGAGVGWKKLTDVANQITGTTSAVLTVFGAYVNSMAVFKVQIKDTDTGSNTYNQYFYDTINFIDVSDPIQLTITSSGGDVFKNGVGSTTLTAKLFQAGVEIDTGGTAYTYKWFQYNKDGVLNANFGGTGINYKTGKTLTVGDADVTVKATFVCEIS